MTMVPNPKSSGTVEKSAHKLFALLLGLSFMVFWKPLWTLGGFAIGSEQYSHILLIPVVTCFLLHQDRRRVFGHLGSDRAWGGAGIAVGLLLRALYLYLASAGQWSHNDQISLAVFSVVLVWLGSFLLSYGRQAFRAALFPLLFLFLIVPIPEAILDSVIVALQRASGEMTAILFRITGIPVFREGLVFVLPNNIVIEVARECSGIRSSLALFITSLLAGHFFLQKWTRKAVLWALVFPITIFKNGLRIATLSVLAVYVDPAILGSAAHRRGGVPFFGLALLVLGAVLWILRRTETSGTQKHAEG